MGLTQTRSTAERQRSLAILEEIDNRRAQRLFYEIYPDEDTPWKGPTILGGLVEPGQILIWHAHYLNPWDALGGIQ